MKLFNQGRDDLQILNPANSLPSLQTHPVFSQLILTLFSSCVSPTSCFSSSWFFPLLGFSSSWFFFFLILPLLHFLLFLFFSSSQFFSLLNSSPLLFFPLLNLFPYLIFSSSFSLRFVIPYKTTLLIFPFFLERMSPPSKELSSLRSQEGVLHQRLAPPQRAEVIVTLGDWGVEKRALNVTAGEFLHCRVSCHLRVKWGSVGWV